jgi:hypothetical protein
MRQPPAEPGGVETPTPATPRPKRAPARKRSAARTTKPKPPPVPVPAPSPPWLLAVRIAALAVAIAAAVFLLIGGEEQPAEIRDGAATPVTAGELGAFARSRPTDVYWAGDVASRALELTATHDATFVRYLPRTRRATAGSSLTIATYPLADAYATATARARSDGMTSRRLVGGGIAVWSLEQPTSVYLAWRGTPSLIEIYAPTPAEARSVALSGRVRPVR